MISVLLGVMLVEAAAFAGVTPPWVVDPNGVVRLDPNELSQGRWDWESRAAEQRYRTEGAEIVPWTQESALASPDNAALLYYQAFLLRPQPDDATFLSINNVLTGGEPDSRTRTYLGRCRQMIHTVEVASLVPQCAWGIRYLDAQGLDEITLFGQVRQLAFDLELDARTLGFDGHYEAALARCLTIRRMARHVGDGTVMAHLISGSINDLSRRAMQLVLDLMPPDVNILQWLRGQLTALQDASGSLEKAMQTDLELALERMRHDTGLLESIRQELAKNASSTQARNEALSQTNEEILALGREPYQRFLDSVFQIMDSDMPYEQKYAAIEKQTAALLEECDHNVATSSVMQRSYGFVGRTVQHWNLLTRRTAAYNVLKTAVEIYLINAQTGRLPEMLPPYTPKDPFSGQDFEYEITTGGFILRCRAEDLYENRIWQYEFKVRE